MHTFFFVCFGVGAGFTIISFLLGELLGHLHIGSDADIDVHLDGLDTHLDGDINIGDACPGNNFETNVDAHTGLHVSPLKPTVIAAFLTVFGGSGLLLLQSFDWLTAFILAALLGLTIAYVIFKFIIVELYKRQNTSAVEKQALIGHNATVTDFIPQGGYGKITYYINGNTYNAPAKSESGQAINKREIVEIVYIQKNTYFVRKKFNHKN